MTLNPPRFAATPEERAQQIAADEKASASLRELGPLPKADLYQWPMRERCYLALFRDDTFERLFTFHSHQDRESAVDLASFANWHNEHGGAVYRLPEEWDKVGEEQPLPEAHRLVAAHKEATGRT